MLRTKYRVGEYGVWGRFWKANRIGPVGLTSVPCMGACPVAGGWMRRIGRPVCVRKKTIHVSANVDQLGNETRRPGSDRDGSLFCWYAGVGDRQQDGRQQPVGGPRPLSARRCDANTGRYQVCGAATSHITRFVSFVLPCRRLSTLGASPSPLGFWSDCLNPESPEGLRRSPLCQPRAAQATPACRPARQQATGCLGDGVCSVANPRQAWSQRPRRRRCVGQSPRDASSSAVSDAPAQSNSQA